MSALISRCKLFNSLAKVQTLGEAYAVIQGMEAEDLTSRIADLEQEDYELYCRTGWSHLSEKQWEWLKGVIQEE